jgi:hypothetical protein
MTINGLLISLLIKSQKEEQKLLISEKLQVQQVQQMQFVIISMIGLLELNQVNMFQWELFQMENMEYQKILTSVSQLLVKMENTLLFKDYHGMNSVKKKSQKLLLNYNKKKKWHLLD